jgi:amino acid adenylation domain-containing protein
MRQLQHLVTARAESQPESIAIGCEDDCLGYGELERQSNQLGRILLESGCLPGDRVGILMPKSISAIVGILGCLKAGCIYVPLDLNSPPARLRMILESCDFRCILAKEPAQPLLDSLVGPDTEASVHVGWLSDTLPPGMSPRFTPRDVAAMPAGPLDSPRNPDGVAHILFTSGSTGTPKGVMITHASVLAFVEWGIGYFGYTPSDRMSGHPPLHFDLSTFDIFGTLAAGARLQLITPAMSLLPHKLAALIRDLELTQWFSVPSLLNYMAKFDVLEPGDFPALRRVLWCGEVFPTPALIYWMRRLPHVTFTNLYGPTEATIASAFYRIPECPADENSRVPIGRACPGETLHVLDENMGPVAAGEVGELYIGGVGLSPGYWRDPEKTRNAFVPSPYRDEGGDRIYRTGDLASVGSDGLFYLHGRIDSQIKSRGYRIELGEIEAAINATGEVRECCVTAVRTEGFEGNTICCAFVPAAGRSVSVACLREKIAEALPAYMLPARWMTLPVLPLNANGKIDRPAIRKQFEANQDVSVAAGAL